MATGDQFTNIVEKRIMGYQDFGAYFFDYTRTLLRDAIKKMFTLNGTFGSTKINITSAANDTFRFDSNREGADSYGHIMANSDSGTNYAFQNTAAQTYQVGLKYGEHPVLLAINPRTALPEFTRYEESLGEAAAPNSVVDNGTNLTLVVDSVTEAGVTNAGRSVRVWKVYPGVDATTLTIALETCTVTWNGSANVITTIGLFGQTTPSTTAADYLVQLVGPTVKRNTDIKDSSYWYIGEITGNGPSATPTVFDMADQNLIPFSLSESQDSSNITMDNSNFHAAPADDSTSGGIGFGDTILQDCLESIDEAIVRRRTAITLSDGTTRTGADYSGADSVDEINTIGNGGKYFVQKGTAYQISANGNIGDIAETPEVIGEISTSGFNGYPSIALQNGSASDLRLQGRFKRLHFRTLDSDNFVQLGYSGARGEAIFDECGFDAGHAIFRGFDAHTRPIVFHDTEFAGGSTAGPGVACLDLLESLGNYPFIVFDRCLIRGPIAAASGQVAILRIGGFGTTDTDPTSQYNRLIVFRDCQIVHDQKTDIPTVLLETNGRQIVSFINTRIKGISAQTVPVFQATGFNTIHMKNVFFDAPGGEAIEIQNGFGILEDLYVYSGDGSGASDPQLIGIRPHSYSEGITIKNLKVFYGDSSGRQGTSPSQAVVELGGYRGNTSNGCIKVDGVQIRATGNIHDNSTLLIRGDSGNDHPANFDNITIDFRGASFGAGADFQRDLVYILGGDNVRVRNLSITNLSEPSSSDTTYSIIRNQGAILENVHIIKQSGNGTYGWANAIYSGIGADSRVKGVKIECYSSYVLKITGVVLRVQGVLEDAHLLSCRVDSSATTYVSITGHVSRVIFPTSSMYISSLDGITANSDNCVIKDCIFNLDSITVVSGGVPIQMAAGADHCVVMGNILRFAASGTVPWISVPTNRCVVVGNILASSNVTAPTISNTGSDNVVANNVEAP